MRIALDFKTHQARLVVAYTHARPPLLAASQGNAQTLANGNTVVGYGGVPEISEYAKDGTLLFDAHLSFELIFYRAFRFPWSARPLTPPAVVANLNNTSEETIVHMSWNGATDVASWRVLAGTHRGSLAAQATVQTTGFETSTILPESFANRPARQDGRLRGGAGARLRRARAGNLTDRAGDRATPPRSRRAGGRGEPGR